MSCQTKSQAARPFEDDEQRALVGGSPSGREAAESLVVALALGKVGFHQLGHVFESVVFVISKPRLFNKNLRENMTTVAALASFTKKQKEILQK